MNVFVFVAFYVLFMCLFPKLVSSRQLMPSLFWGQFFAMVVPTKQRGLYLATFPIAQQQLVAFFVLARLCFVFLCMHNANSFNGSVCFAAKDIPDSFEHFVR